MAKKAVGQLYVGCTFLVLLAKGHTLLVEIMKIIWNLEPSECDITKRKFFTHSFDCQVLRLIDIFD